MNMGQDAHTLELNAIKSETQVPTGPDDSKGEGKGSGDGSGGDNGNEVDEGEGTKKDFSFNALSISTLITAAAIISHNLL